jgi:hypothetical protein
MTEGGGEEEIAMWRAVICQAIRDAKGGKPAALRWFRCNSDDFRTVCDLAAISPDKLREKLTREIYKKNKKSN